MSKKQRLDELLVQRGIAPDLKTASAWILAAEVLVNDSPVTQAGETMGEDVAIRVRKRRQKWVARSAEKLLQGLAEFKLAVNGKVALDIGASAGGFTEVLLQQGAKRIYAVDVGTNQLAWKIRQDPAVVSLEKTDARKLSTEQIPQPCDLITIDVSFISVARLVPSLIPLAGRGADWVILIKPQFEALPQEVEDGGLIEDGAVREAVVARITQVLEAQGLKRLGLVPASMKGSRGNQEYLSHWRLGSD